MEKVPDPEAVIGSPLGSNHALCCLGSLPVLHLVVYVFARNSRSGNVALSSTQRELQSHSGPKVLS